MIEEFDQSEAPALPPARRIPRYPPDENTIPFLQHFPPDFEARSQENNGSFANSPPPVPKPRKPIPLPRSRLLRKSPETSENAGNTTSPCQEEPLTVDAVDRENGYEYSIEGNQLVNEDYVGSAALTGKQQEFSIAPPMKFVYPLLTIVSHANTIPLSCSSYSPSSVLPRSVSDTSAFVAVRSSNLIKWDSLETNLDNVPTMPLTMSLDRHSDVWSIDNTPPDYSPPPPPPNVPDVLEDKLVLVEPPPPLPPRPTKRDSLVMHEISAPPLPLPTGNKIAVRHESEIRNGIATLCSDFLAVKFSNKDVGKRWCVLKDGKLSMYVDSKGRSAKNTISCGDMQEVSILEKKNKLSFGFIVSAMSDRNKPWAFLTESSTDLSRWLSALAKAICDASGMYSTAPRVGSKDFEFGGKIFFRHGSNGDWIKSWVELTGRTLQIFSEDVVAKYDLRKAISFNVINVEFYESKSAAICALTAEESNPFILSLPGSILHFQADNEKQTSRWMNLMQKRAKECGEAIEDQPLTGEDVPVVVDKCIQFVSAHGLKSKGIYRQSGVSSKIAAILDMFAKDAHSCYLSREHFTEHDVTGALKRFLRQLPEPVIKMELYQPLLHCTEISDVAVKVEKYYSLLNQLPRVPNYVTLRKLLGHLKVVSESAADNLMSISNIAASFGNTLMSGNMDNELADSLSGSSFDTATKEIIVMVDFLEFYEKLFDVDEAHMLKERKILDALEIINKQLQQPPRAGDFLMGVYWIDRSGDPVNMRLNSKLTAGQLCQILLEKEKMPSDNSYCLHEVIFDEKLWRPVHYTEEVTPIILRWTDWNGSNICEYSSNYLCVRKDTVFDRVAKRERTPLSLTQQLRFSKEKIFKKVSMDFSKMTLAVHKSSTSEKDMGSWKVEDIIWFYGNSPQRSSPTKWNFTFIEKDNNSVLNRLKENRTAFGYTVCCDDEESLNKWVAALLQAQYNSDLLPPITS